MFGRGFRRRSTNRRAVNTTARRSNRRGSQRSNAVLNPVTTYQRSASNAPTRTVKTPVIRPAVDPKRPTITGHSGTGSPTGGLPALDRPIKQVKQPVVRPIVDPMRQPITRPQYGKGGSVSRTGHVDYRKNGMFKK